MHKTFTRVVTRQFDAHNIDTFFRSPIYSNHQYIYIFFVVYVFSIHSVPREGISFFLPSFLPLRIEREKADRIDARNNDTRRTFLSLIGNNLYQEERDLFVILKRMPGIVIDRRSRYRIGLNLYPPGRLPARFIIQTLYRSRPEHGIHFPEDTRALI